MDSIAPPPRDHDRALDVAVALEVAGFRWVAWNRVALAGAPVATTGRFLAAPDDLMAHLQRPAAPTEPESEDCLARVPRFSESADDAFRAAERAGLFRGGGADLRREPGGAWVVCVAALDASTRSEHLTEAVCRAALLWARERGDR